MPLTTIVATLSLVFGPAWAIWQFAHSWGEKRTKVIPADRLALVGNWLVEGGPAIRAERIAGAWVSIFDSFFGGKHWSWRCFKRSSAASATISLAISLLFLAAHFDKFQRIESKEHVFLSFALGMMSNVFVDYFSLLETRFVLGKIEASRGRGAFWWLGLDLIATGTFAFFALYLWMVMVGIQVLFRVWPDVSFAYLLASQWAGYGPMIAGEAFGGAFFWSTFSTSLWVWLFALAWFLVRVTPVLGWIQRTRFVDLQNEPYHSLGHLVAWIGASLWVIGSAAYLLLIG